MQRKPSKLPLILGTVFLLAGGIAIFGLLKGISDSVNVMTAAKDLPAYSFVKSGDLEVTSVPSGSVTESDLTEEEFKDKYKEELVILGPVLKGQRIDQRIVPDGDASSFAVVLPDERVVAATSTVAGAAVGTVQAGDVVDVLVGSNDGSSLASGSFAKVLCIGTNPSDCRGILPPGVKINADDTDSGSTRASSDAPVLVLLAVAEENASVAGQSVTLALNPFCRVDKNGYFYSPREDQGDDFLCQAPSDRLAARGPLQKAAQDEAADTSDDQSSD